MKTLQKKLALAVTSRTVWVVIVMFIIGGVESIALYIPDNIETLLLSILGVLAVWFKVSPSQDYS